jgi:type IV pilus assembly protein PilA
MLARLTKLKEEREEGFTLIELLVVIIIIGILAAIAIPVFLSQRQKGYDAGVKSDLRNLATAEESYLTDNNAYTDTVATLTAQDGFKPSSDGDYATGGSAANLTVVSDTNQVYCITGVSASGKTWFYDSGAGGLQPLAATYTCSDAAAA